MNVDEVGSKMRTYRRIVEDGYNFPWKKLLMNEIVLINQRFPVFWR